MWVWDLPSSTARPSYSAPTVPGQPAGPGFVFRRASLGEIHPGSSQLDPSSTSSLRVSARPSLHSVEDRVEIRYVLTIVDGWSGLFSLPGSTLRLMLDTRNQEGRAVWVARPSFRDRCVETQAVRHMANDETLDREAAGASSTPLDAMWSGPGVNAVSRPEDEFRTLYEEWRRDTATSSSMRTKALHPAYRRIVAMGEQAIPLILDQLRRQPSHIFWALHEITGANPVQPASAGKVMEMIGDWLKWGAMQGYEVCERISSGTSHG